MRYDLLNTLYVSCTLAYRCSSSRNPSAAGGDGGVPALSMMLSEPRPCEYVLWLESPLACGFVSRADQNGFVSSSSVTGSPASSSAAPSQAAAQANAPQQGGGAAPPVAK